MKLFSYIEYISYILLENIPFIIIVIQTAVILFLLNQNSKRQGFLILKKIQLGIPFLVIWEADEKQIFQKANEKNVTLEKRLHTIEENMAGGVILLIILCLPTILEASKNKKTSVYKLALKNVDYKQKFSNMRQDIIARNEDPDDLLNYDFADLR